MMPSMVHIAVCFVLPMVHGNFLRGLPTSSFDTCLSNLLQVSNGDDLDGEEFLAFLGVASDGNLMYAALNDVPLSLLAIFYTAACSDGRDCKNTKPSVSLTGTGITRALLELFCRQVDDFIPDLMDVNFRYLVRYKNGLSGDEVLAGVNNNTIVADLKVATERVVLEALQCPVERRLRRKRISSVLRVEPRVPRLASQRGEDRRMHVLQRTIRRTLQECPFLVEAGIGDMINYGKLHQCMAWHGMPMLHCSLIILFSRLHTSRRIREYPVCSGVVNTHTHSGLLRWKSGYGWFVSIRCNRILPAVDYRSIVGIHQWCQVYRGIALITSGPGLPCSSMGWEYFYQVVGNTVIFNALFGVVHDKTIRSRRESPF
jgi:hypothetical protein